MPPSLCVSGRPRGCSEYHGALSRPMAGKLTGHLVVNPGILIPARDCSRESRSVPRRMPSARAHRSAAGRVRGTSSAHRAAACAPSPRRALRVASRNQQAIPTFVGDEAGAASLRVRGDNGAAGAHRLGQHLRESLLIRCRTNAQARAANASGSSTHPTVSALRADAEPLDPRGGLAGPAPRRRQQPTSCRGRSSAKASMSKSSRFHGVILEVFTNTGGPSPASQGCGGEARFRANSG